MQKRLAIGLGVKILDQKKLETPGQFKDYRLRDAQTFIVN